MNRGDGRPRYAGSGTVVREIARRDRRIGRPVARFVGQIFAEGRLGIVFRHQRADLLEQGFVE
ncbi:hypothetical protein HDG35_003706 [Paraburkholderia sp. JPY681]|nr:hypothetical protein [Paraburkholderia atlantica]